VEIYLNGNEKAGGETVPPALFN